MLQIIGVLLFGSGCLKKTDSSASEIRLGTEESSPLEDKRSEKEDSPSSNSAGFVDKNIIDSEIRKHTHDISACYERALQENPSMSGFVMVQFVIANNGTVSRATTTEDTLGSQALTECILAEFMTMQFPVGLKNDAINTSQEPQGRELTISYPLRFASE